MNLTLVIIGTICLFAGLAGCIAPVLPGVPLAYAGLWLLHATDQVQFTWWFLLVWGIVTLVVQVLDFFIPAWTAKYFGGSKQGAWGSTLGVVGRVLWGVWGILLGPFIGSFIGELIAGKSDKEALQTSLGSFVGFFIGTIIKLFCVGGIMYFFVAALIECIASGVTFMN